MIGEMRLIFTTPITNSTDEEKAQDGFPSDEFAPFRPSVQFSKQTFDYIQNRFQLPRVSTSNSIFIGSYVVPCPITHGETTLEGTSM